MAPLFVSVNPARESEDDFDVRVGPHGRPYVLKFVDVLNLVRNRCGFDRKRLEYKPR